MSGLIVVQARTNTVGKRVRRAAASENATRVMKSLSFKSLMWACVGS